MLAGFGKRISEYTKDPKCLLKINDKTLIERNLTYLKDLGITAIWISPFYKSPQKDFGYDISDFKDVGKIYGTMKDFDNLEKLSITLPIKTF